MYLKGDKKLAVILYLAGNFLGIWYIKIYVIYFSCATVKTTRKGGFNFTLSGMYP